MSLLSKFLNLCCHRWVIIEEYNLVDSLYRPNGKKYIIQCQYCGNIEKREIY